MAVSLPSGFATTVPFLFLNGDGQSAEASAGNLRSCGLANDAVIEADLMEWNYGDFEGLKSTEIRAHRPGWIVFRDGCPNGETPEEVGTRVDRIVCRALAVDGDVALFAHGHVLRTLAARWIGLPPQGGMHFLLDTGTLCVLGFYRDQRAIKIWNAPLVS
jgi:probable phosphoglycerate mutase